MKPTVLIFNIPQKKKASLQVICMKLGLRALTVPPEKYGLSLEDILSGKEHTEALETPLTDEMLVLCGLSEKTLDALLAELRKQRATVALKAVLTDTNRSWSPWRLWGELSAEREAIAKGETAHQ